MVETISETTSKISWLNLKLKGITLASMIIALLLSYCAACKHPQLEKSPTPLPISAEPSPAPIETTSITAVEESPKKAPTEKSESANGKTTAKKSSAVLKSTDSLKIVKDPLTGMVYTAGKLHVTFNQIMNVGKEYVVSAKVSRGNIIVAVEGEGKKLEVFDVVISPKITISVSGEDFHITLSEETPKIQTAALPGKYCEWKYKVIPLKTGQLSLTIKVGNVSEDGATITYYQNEEKVVNVKVSYTLYKALLLRLKAHYTEYFWLYSILGTVCSVVGINSFVQKRKKQNGRE